MIEIYTFPVIDLVTDRPLKTRYAEVDDHLGLLLGLEQAAKRVEEAAEADCDDVMAYADPELAKSVPTGASGIEERFIVPCPVD